MKKIGKKSSNIVDARSDKERMKEESKTDMMVKAMENDRTLRSEPIAWNNDKSPDEEFVASMTNPGKVASKFPGPMIKSPGQRRHKKDPAPGSFKKGGKNYDMLPDFEFFKHTIKGK